MMTLGFMSLSHQHEKAYAEELAKKASDYGIVLSGLLLWIFPRDPCL